MASNVKLIRLLSGEELMGELVNNNLLTEGNTNDWSKGPIQLKNPLLVLTQPQGDNVRIGFAPWILFKEKDQVITIREHAIVSTMEPDKQLLEQYNRATSKLALPDTNLVVPTK